MRAVCGRVRVVRCVVVRAWSCGRGLWFVRAVRVRGCARGARVVVRAVRVCGCARVARYFIFQRQLWAREQTRWGVVSVHAFRWESSDKRTNTGQKKRTKHTNPQDLLRTLMQLNYLPRVGIDNTQHSCSLLQLDLNRRMENIRPN